MQTRSRDASYNDLAQVLKKLRMKSSSAMCPLGHFSVLTTEKERPQYSHELAPMKIRLKAQDRQVGGLPERKAEAKQVHDAFQSDRNDILLAIGFLARQVCTPCSQAGRLYCETILSSEFSGNDIT